MIYQKKIVLIISLLGALLSHSAFAQSISWDGLGIHPLKEAGITGYYFRVWAPNGTNITTASVSGKHLPLSIDSGNTSVWQGASCRTMRGTYFINDSVIYKDDPHNVNTYALYDQDAYTWNDADFSPPDRTQMIVYEMHIGTYGNNDTNTSNAVFGSFLTAIERLDHLADLGINAVELMPVHDNTSATSWGYDPTKPFLVSDIYGGPDAFKQFIDACHTRGIAVILDIIHNHYGDGNDAYWKNFLVDYDGWSGGDNGGGIYFYQDPALSHTPWGRRPHYGRENVRKYIKDNVRHWLGFFRLDGLRWDAPHYMERADGYTGTLIPDGTSLLQECNRIIHDQYQNRISIAEGPSDTGFDAEWQFEFHHQLKIELTKGEDSARDMDVINHLIMDSNGMARVVYTESHDEVGDLNGTDHVRMPTAISPTSPVDYYARKRSYLGAAVTFTVPGIPMLFQGQELLATNQFSSESLLDWNTLTNHTETFSFYRDLIRLRRNLSGKTAGLTGGGAWIQKQDDSNKVIVYERWLSGGNNDNCLVIANFSATTHTNYPTPFPHAGTWNLQFNSDDLQYGSDFSGQGIAQITVASDGEEASTDIGPYSVLVYSRGAVPPSDIDFDGMPDTWETTYGLNPNSRLDAAMDKDEDGYSNLEEFQNGTLPDVIEAYRSNFNSMSIAGSHNGWDIGANNMTLTGPFIWQSDVVFTNVAQIEFKFFANATNTINWGDLDQFDRWPDLMSTAEGWGPDILIEGPLIGAYRFTFNERVQRYSVIKLVDADGDGDGMSDIWEGVYGLNPGVQDGFGDLDIDGLSNVAEFEHRGNPTVGDTDGDGLDDNFEARWDMPLYLNLSAFTDMDMDDLTDAEEGVLGTNPINPDTDGDGLTDSEEKDLGLNPLIPDDLNSDADNDGLTLEEEIYEGTSPTNPDSDNDDMPDGWEAAFSGLDPMTKDDSSDPDGDGLTNLQEYTQNTRPDRHNQMTFTFLGASLAGQFNDWGTGADPMSRDMGAFRLVKTLSSTSNLEFKVVFNGSRWLGVASQSSTILPLDLDLISDGGAANITLTAPLSGEYEFIFFPVENKLMVKNYSGTPTDLDQDNDNMLDVWESRHGLNTSVNDALLDRDLDGVLNIDEFTAGTPANDSDGNLSLEIETEGNQVTLRWTAFAEPRAYTLEYCNDLLSGEWHSLSSGNQGYTTPGPASASDIMLLPLGFRYYRIRSAIAQP